METFRTISSVLLKFEFHKRHVQGEFWGSYDGRLFENTKRCYKDERRSRKFAWFINAEV
jgi:hypothetical protein